MLDCNLCIILLTTFLSNTIYGLAAPFLPQLLEAKGIEPTWTGLIFAAYAIATIFVSLIAGKIVDRVSHAWIMFIGTLLMSGSIAAFSIAFDLEENWEIIAFSIGLRLAQGKIAF